MSAENPRLRLGILGIVIVSLFAALFARLWYLQVMATTQFKTAAQALQTRTILEEAPRGRIFDRNGVVMVDNRVSVVVTVDKKNLPDATKHPTERAALQTADDDSSADSNAFGTSSVLCHHSRQYTGGEMGSGQYGYQ